MGIGTAEIAFILVVTLASAAAAFVGKQREVPVLAAFCLIAVLVSPADLFSALLIAGPNCLLYLLATKYRSPGLDHHTSSAG
ncbi:hypothetical protein Mal4_48120 [Maioricimonas rarisocia]|uniref:Uncharacterized protein n=1 Tax=Maioricimonas rarisocia TaxID=2528026 RepID=A0A517ZDA8_9PLAN|nr:hypothetical protein [Maioricimonas rarisocia]QDU40455.1 hypothetical protein Mal4_48120 [Maioricimonas rarisocia]